MKKKQKVNTEIIEIPEYELLNQRPRCKKCRYRRTCEMNCTGSETGAKIYCEKFARKFYTCEMIIFLVMEIYGMFKISSLDKDVLTLSIIAIAYTIILIIFEAVVSKIAKLISEFIEINRRKNYETEVEKIKKSNEKLKRMQNGETEEFLEFIKKVQKITDEVIFNYCLLRQMDSPAEDKYFEENNLIADKYQNLSCELEKTTLRINPKNYHPNYKFLQTFYNSYMKALIEKMNMYMELYKKGKLTSNQIEEYNKLLDNFINKIKTCNEKIDEVEGQEILDDIRQLNTLISSDDTNL